MKEAEKASINMFKVIWHEKFRQSSPTAVTRTTNCNKSHQGRKSSLNMCYEENFLK